MSRLVLALRDAPDRRLDLSVLAPARLAGLETRAIERLALTPGARPISVGDVFSVSGTPGETVCLEGSSSHFDAVGCGLDAGTLIVEGDVGAFAASAMRAGRLDIRGNAGHGLAAGMNGGLVTVAGGAGDGVGAPRIGERFGMAGGLLVVAGNVGARAGDRMRRGTILVKGRCAEAAGSRMMGGTIRAEHGFGTSAGALMRRGTLIAPRIDDALPTFADCGRHDLVALRLIDRFLAAQLGPLAPPPLPASVRKLMGDLATIGKGEILLTA